MMSDQTIREKLPSLPNQPGCYLMKDVRGDVIYVGKANVLKNRVRSYFTGSHDAKTHVMVGQIDDFEYIVTTSQVEALLLESNLIKKYKPRYNVLLRDDKSYPYIKLTYDTHPRLEVTRDVKKGDGKYFGPYPNAGAAQQTKKLLDKLYPLRKCRTIPDRACLYYHMDQCLAPCIQEVEPSEYKPMIREIQRFLNGNHEGIRRELQRKMHQASEQLDFEKAKEMRDQIHDLDRVMEKQKITFNDDVDRDVFGYYTDKGWMCVQVFYVRRGKLIERDVSRFPYYREKEADFLSFITQFYMEHRPDIMPKEIFLPDLQGVELIESALDVKVHIPKRGLKKQLVDMAIKNARVALEEKFQLMEKDEARTEGAVRELGEALDIGDTRRIEAFDNSNIQGTDPVSAMVVFIDGKPAKKEYRKYKIRTVEGSDDVATMKEVIRRRYTRVLKEDLPLPDLVLVDGGKAQVSAAADVLENELGLYIPTGGLAKNEKHQTSELVMGEPPHPVSLKRTSQAFYLLQRIQEEVHRFAVSFHRQTRKKTTFRSQLDSIPGIGPKRKKTLYQHFGSVRKMKEASMNEYREIGIGDNLARTILSHLNEG